MKKLPKVSFTVIKCECGSFRGNRFTDGRVICLVCGNLYRKANRKK